MRATALALMGAVLAQGPGAAASGASVGKRAPVLSGQTLEEGGDARATPRRPSVIPYTGHVTVVTFGASWCQPCRKELPALDKIAEGFAKRKARVRFVAVNIDEDAKAGLSFVKDVGLKNMTVLFDSGKKLVTAFDPSKMPTTYVVTNGVLAHEHGGYKAGDEALLMRVVNRELAKIPNPPDGRRKPATVRPPAKPDTTP